MKSGSDRDNRLYFTPDDVASSVDVDGELVAS
jgi:hypothetical protein